MLHACARMAHSKSAFAELLLPLAFADLALHGSRDESDGTAHHVAIAISAGLLPACPTNPKAMRLLLRCLNHLHSMYLDGIKQRGTTAVPLSGARGGGSSGGGDAAISGQRPLTAEEVKSWPRVYWIDLDYLHVADAAVQCRAHFSALMYIETWCEVANLGVLGLPSVEMQPRRAEADALLLQIYSRIEEPDGLYAVARSNDLLPQLRRFEREGNWADALVSWDLALQMMRSGANGRNNTTTLHLHSSGTHGISRKEAEAGVLRCLSNLGASNLLWMASRATAGTRNNNITSSGSGGGVNLLPFSSSSSSSSTAAAAAAALGEWTPLDPGAGEESRAADAGLTAAVAALASGSAERCGQAVASSRRSLVAALATAGLESTGDVNPALIRLQMLHEVAESWDLKWPNLPDLGSVGSPTKNGGGGRPGSSTSNYNYNNNNNNNNSRMDIDNLEEGSTFQRALKLWQGREVSAGAGGRYALLAPLQDLRRELLRVLRVPAAEAECLAQSAAAARKTGHFGQASGSLLRLRSLAESGVLPALAAPNASWRVEETKVLWARGQTDAALTTIRNILTSMRTISPHFMGSSSVLDRPYVQALAAKWMAATRTESTFAVQELYNEAAQEAEKIPVHPRTCRIFYRFAQYTSDRYRAIKEQKASSEWAVAQAVVRKKQEDLAARRARYTERYSNTDKSHGAGRMRQDIRQLTLQLDSDMAAAASLDDQEAFFRQNSMAAYGRCLIAGYEYDLPALFRVIQMWLENAEDRHVNENVAEVFTVAASHKFLPLIIQVASRLSAAADGPLVQSGFQSTLQHLLVRLGKEHPFQSLLSIVALKNGNRGADGRVVTPGAGGGDLAYIADEEKVVAAGNVLRAVAATDARMKEIVRQLEIALECYIQLAAMPVEKTATQMTFPAVIRRQLV